MRGQVCRMTLQASCSGRSQPSAAAGGRAVHRASSLSGWSVGRGELRSSRNHRDHMQGQQLLGVVRAEETGAQPTRSSSSSSNIDTERAVALAAQRLENLLSGTGNGETELMNNIIREMAPETKTAGYCVAGGIAGSIGAVGCFFLNIDPLGGMDMSTNTLIAGAAGALCGLPMIALRQAKWSNSMIRRFPQLATIQEQQVESNAPVYEGLSHLQDSVVMAAPQMALVASISALTGCVWELALIQGGIQQLYLDLGSVLEWKQPEMPAVLVALIVAATSRGISDALSFQEDPEELKVVQNALENCDRYYNVMDPNKSNSSEMAAAFKAVAFVWFREKRKAQWLAFWLGAAEIAYGTILWRLTGNLATPAMAFALGSGADIVGLMERSKLKLTKDK